MGLPEMSLKNVSLENAVFEAEEGITAIDADGLKLTNVRVLSKDAALTLYNSKNVEVSGLKFAENDQPAVRVMGKGSENINLSKRISRLVVHGHHRYGVHCYCINPGITW